MKINSKEQGFTMIELIVVITLMGVLAAVLVPQVSILIQRARMQMDVTNVREAQSQVEAYKAATEHMPGLNEPDIMSTLVDKGYYKSEHLSDGHIKLKTRGASVIYDTNSELLKLEVSPLDYNLFNNDPDKSMWLTS